MRLGPAAFVVLVVIALIGAMPSNTQRIVALEAKVAELDARVTALEGAPTPSPTPTSSCAPVANLATAIANASSGATIKVGGTYTLTGIIRTSKALTIEACAPTTITSGSNVRQDYLYFTGGPNVVKGVTFKAGAGNFHDSNGSALLECEGCHDLTVVDTTFIGHANLDDHQQLFYQRLGRNVTCTRCTFQANGSDGFGFHQYPGSTTNPVTVVEDSYFEGFNVNGAGVTTDSRITVRRSSFKNDYRGIQLRNSATGSVLSDNIDLGGVTIRVEGLSKAAVNTWR
jgi:hypothetical protein